MFPYKLPHSKILRKFSFKFFCTHLRGTHVLKSRGYSVADLDICLGKGSTQLISAFECGGTHTFLY